MDRLEALIKLLEGASVIVSWAAQEIVAVPFEPKSANLETAVQALTNIGDLRLKLYEQRPHLTPMHLKTGIENLPNRRVYDASNPTPPEIQAKIEIAEAVQVLEALEAMDGNIHLKKMAREQLPALRAKLNET